MYVYVSADCVRSVREMEAARASPVVSYGLCGMSLAAQSFVSCHVERRASHGETTSAHARDHHWLVLLRVLLQWVLAICVWFV